MVLGPNPHRVKRHLTLLLFAFALSGCATAPPVLHQTGTMPPGGTIVVRNIRGDVNAYAPERGQPPNTYTIAAYAPGSNPLTTIVKRPLLITVKAQAPGVRYLIRGSKDGSLDLSTGQGSIMVADYEGVVNAHVGRGDIKMLIPQYGNASIENGNISVIFAGTDWNGTLHFAAGTGNVELYVNEKAKAHIRLHTDDGNVFSDFPLKGTSSGNSETIDSVINGGAARAIDVEVKTGSIRLMQLKPQI